MSNFSFITTTGNFQIAATIGRGTGPPSINFVNLANKIPFSITEMALADTAGLVNNLNTTLSQTTMRSVNQADYLNMEIVDCPGSIGTFTYAVRVLATSDPNALFIRQNSLYALKVRG
jgi:hypothetical protein